jgi:hypothetical protein
MKRIIVIAFLLLFVIACEKQVAEIDEDYCNSDDECVPFPTCHPMTCINKKFEANYEKPEMCTLEYRFEAAYNEEDCICENSKCTNKNLKNLEIDSFEKCVKAGNPVMESYPRQCRTPDGRLFVEEFQGIDEQIIGGETDERGCLGAAGYTWNPTVEACLIEWELEESEKEAARIAVASIEYVKGTTIIEVRVLKCPGCFTVTIQQEGENIQVNLQNWEVVE